MGRRFVPVPYDALNLCDNDAEQFAIMRLYREAHGSRWGPFVLSVRQFASWAGLRLQNAVALLRRLEDAGLADRVDGPRGGASMIEVFDPSTPSGTGEGRSAERHTEHLTRRPDAAQRANGGTPRGTSPPGFAEHPPRVDARVGEPNRTEHKNDPPPPPVGGSPESDGVRREWVAETAHRTLAGLGGEAATALAAKWAKPDQDEITRLLELMRGARRSSPGHPRRPAMPGCPEGVRRRDVALGVVEAVRRWSAMQRDAPDPADDVIAATPT